MCSWWRYDMEAFSALLSLCDWNPPIPVNSYHKGTVTLCFDVYASTNDWTNGEFAGDLRGHSAHVTSLYVSNPRSPTMSICIRVSSHEHQGVSNHRHSYDSTCAYDGLRQPKNHHVSALLALCAGNQPTKGQCCGSVSNIRAVTSRCLKWLGLRPPTQVWVIDSIITGKYYRWHCQSTSHEAFGVSNFNPHFIVYVITYSCWD